MRDERSPSTVIVAGASRGIGAAVAKELAAPGVTLVLGYATSDEAMAGVATACEGRGATVVTVKGDVAEEVTARALVDAALGATGRVDVLVANAGVSRDDLLLSQDDEAIAAMLDTNVWGTVRIVRAVLRPMLRQRGGSIVTVSSVLATRPGRGNAVYAGTKGFIESFTRAVAVEVARKGIRVNAVAPGVIETDMSAETRRLAGATLLDRIASRRIGTTEEVARVVAHLASPDSSYCTGAVIPVDGGFVGGV